MQEIRSLYRQQIQHQTVIETLKCSFSENWSDEDVQDDFIKTIINEPLIIKYPVRGQYKYSILKQLVKEIENIGAATSDLLIEEMCECQTTVSAQTNINSELASTGRGLEYSFKTFSIDSEEYSLKVWPEFSQVGLALWPAGYAIADWVIENKNKFNSESTIVELGSGVGLTAIVAAKVTNASKIVMTDYLQTVNDNAIQNLKEFSFEPPRVLVKELDWEKLSNNDPTTVNLIKELDTTCLLAADVVYDRSVIPALADTMAAFLKYSPRLEQVAFAVTHRNEETFKMLLTEISRCGLALTEQPYPESTGSFYYERHLIKIYGITLNRNSE